MLLSQQQHHGNLSCLMSSHINFAQGVESADELNGSLMNKE